MNTAMPVGVEDFAEIRSNYYWVDKTAVISAFLQDHKKVTLFTRLWQDADAVDAALFL